LMPSAGTCQVMGTASTMALMAEAIGMMLPGGASIPAVHADRLRHAELSGARAVELARLATQDAGDTRVRLTSTFSLATHFPIRV
jgi:dihydroxyacid dehydratase/phosphogluconate dehydratase